MGRTSQYKKALIGQRPGNDRATTMPRTVMSAVMVIAVRAEAEASDDVGCAVVGW